MDHENCPGCNRVKEHQVRLDEGDNAIHELREMIADVQDKVSSILEIFTAGEGFFKVVGWIGKAVKWLSVIALALASLWAVLHGNAK